MTDPLALAAGKLELTDEQRQAFLEQLSDDKTLGVTVALRRAGVQGSKGQLRRLFRDDEELQEDARLARGWNVNRVEGVTWEVALDKDHPAWDRANARVLKAYNPAYRDQSHVEMTGPGGGPVEVANRDVADALDRFTGQIRRLAERAQSSGTVRAPDTGAAELSPGEPGS